ncbi:chemosensory pili system protein ChpA (sensor histidine kinase/response regulator) [Plasticicumulans lactativorans]|uniref:Chemotaxis protein CheA n=1 Tax=Plasticicumulans lactativorans TaxID=1133106 RepID=A0A4R2LB73_9GAMM|nr:response regulator [Plasticicumulans lactativorans]TCO81516.1 chemosensory pili system protein ChpA (sensor histidine kinase/response regulator) [Plasticicumulans lactativorans]
MSEPRADIAHAEVRAELDATLGRVRSALEAFFAAPTGSASLDGVIAGLRQIQGACAMLEDADSAAQAAELLDLATRIGQQGGLEPAEAREHLLEQVLALGHRLAWQRVGRRPEAPAGEADDDPARALVRSIATGVRPAFQRALLGLLRGPSPGPHLAAIERICTELKAACRSGADYELWWRLQGVAETLAQFGLPPVRAQNLLLRDADRQLRLLAETGAGDADAAGRVDLIRRLEAELTTSATGRMWLTDRVDYHPEAPGSDAGGYVLADPETVRLIAAELAEQLAVCRGALDASSRSAPLGAGQLAEDLALLPQVANVLDLLEAEAPVALARHWLDRLAAAAVSGEAFDEGELMALAADLVLLESSVEHLGTLAFAPPGSVAQDPLADLTAIDTRQARSAVLREAVELLRQARGEVDARLRGEAGDVAWNEAAAHLGRVIGILAVLECGAEQALVTELLATVRALAGAGAVDDTFAGAVADAMVVAEYALEQRAAGQAFADGEIERAREHLVAARRVDVPHLPPPRAEPQPAFAADAIQAPPVPAEEPAAAALDWVPEPPAAPAEHALPTELEVADDAELERLFVAARAAEPAPTAAAAAADIDLDLLEVFLEEAAGEFDSIAGHLARLERRPDDLETLRHVRRAFHTLKGSGRMVGEQVAGEFAWAVENLLNQVLEGRCPSTPVLIATIAEAARALQAWLADPQRAPATRERLRALEARIVELLAAALEAPEAVVPAAPESVAAPEPVPEPVPVPAAAAEEPAAQPVAAPEPVTEQALDRTLGALAGHPAFAPPPAPPPALPSGPEWLEAILLVLDDCQEGSTASREALIQALRPLTGPDFPEAVMRLAAALEAYLVRLRALGRGLDGNDILLCEECAAVFGDLTEGSAVEAEAVDELLDHITRRGQALVVTAPVAAARREADRELATVFIGEAGEILDAAEVTLARWRHDRANPALLNDLRREMHTLKGSSRMAGYTQVGDLAHATESLLDAVSNGTAVASDAIADGLQRALDRFVEMLGVIEGGDAAAAADELIQDLHDLLASGTVRAPAAVPAPRAGAVAVAGGNVESVRVSNRLLDALVNQIGETSIFRARLEQGVSTLRGNLGELRQTVERLRAQLRQLEIETEKQILFRYERGGADGNAEFDPLELDRFSEVQQLSRALAEVADDLGSLQESLLDQTHEMSSLLEQQGKVDKELQQGVLQTRVVRIDSVVPRLRRVVRQAAEDTGKRAELLIEGADAEVERTLLDTMVAPLEHVLRNAVSHGIEPPALRAAAGKPETGTITLNLRREGSEVLITVADDGAGLDFAAIRATAEKRGVLAPGALASEADLAGLLMMPGFSTAREVTQVAGRGVGLDVLAEAVKTLRGAVHVHSRGGQGVTFTIRLPYSLSITQALLVRASGETYAIPLLAVEAVGRLGGRAFRDYLGGHPVEHDYAGDVFPVHSLAVAVGGEPPQPGSIEGRPPVLLFRSADQRAAIQVDAVLGRQEIIVKPVGPQLAAIPGISGATVLGDGQVVLILDMAALLRKLAQQTLLAAEAKVLRRAREGGAGPPVSALVIDDSITMRKVTARFLERHGIQVGLAKDGIDAVARLDQSVPDVVILDIEMPRMDGFELVAHIRNQARLRHLPVIMVTSRTGDKHRERAARLGVNAYLGKPYQERELLATIRAVLGARAAALPSP